MEAREDSDNRAVPARFANRRPRLAAVEVNANLQQPKASEEKPKKSKKSKKSVSPKPDAVDGDLDRSVAARDVADGAAPAAERAPLLRRGASDDGDNQGTATVETYGRFEMQLGGNPRLINYEPQLHVMPAWAKRFSELRLYSNATLSSQSSRPIQALLTADLAALQQLRLEVQFNADGGWLLGPGHATVETVPDRQSAARSDPFWSIAGAASEYLASLEEQLVQMLRIASSAESNSQPPQLAPIGEQEAPLPTAATTARAAVLKRRWHESVSRLLHQTSGAQGSQAEATPVPCAHLSAGLEVPIVHDRFVIPPEECTMDPLAVKAPDMLSSPQSVADRHTERSALTVHVPFVRFRESPHFNEEQASISQLLDAYEQYQLLVSNLRNDLKSRTFYRQIAQVLETQLRVGRLQQQQTPAQVPTGTASAAAAELQEYLAQVELQLATIKEFQARAAEAERACITVMIGAWRQVQHHRQVQGYQTVKLTLALRKHGGADVADRPDDVLCYVPVLTDADLAAPPPSSSSVPANVTVPIQPLRSTSSRQPPTPLHSEIRVEVFARTSRAISAQRVGTTAARAINSTGTAHFNETFELRTAHDPSELVLQILDSENHTLASTRIPSSTHATAMLLPFQSSVFFVNAQGEPRSVTGVISVATTWTTSEGLTVEAIERMFLRGEADPLDPRNEKFVALLRKHYMESDDPSSKSDSNAEASDGRAVLQMGAGGLYLPTAPTLTLRQQLLQKRWQLLAKETSARDDVESKLVSMQMPLDDAAVKRLYRDSSKESAALRDGATSPRLPSYTSRSGDSEQETHSRWQRRLESLKVMHQSKRRLPDHEKLANVVVLPPLPTFAGIFQYIVDIFSPQSNLNPRRDKLKEVSEIDVNKLQSSQIVVHVLKASHLPTRDDDTPLEPVVEARFISFSASGRVEVGSHPSWFESLRVRFEPPDFREETLSLIDDDIVIGIYDHLRVALPQLTTTLGATPKITHFREERRLLGTVKIPFYTLYTTEKANVEGLFTIQTPRWVMGYRMPDVPSTIQLYVALNPPLRHPKPQDRFDVTDLQGLPITEGLNRLHMMAMSWRDQMDVILAGILAENPMASWRRVDPFVPDFAGNPTLICRYILPRGGPPPPTVTTIPAAIRFVSLQRFEVDIVTWGDRDVWSTNAEFIAAERGDYEEMALLLIHFLRYLAPTEAAFLVLGKGDNYHQAAFVLHTIQGTQLKLIDPRTGDICDVHNPHCSLTEVSMVVSHHQVWGNIQLSGTPYRMMWDLHDARYWLPMLPQPLHDPALQAALVEPLQRERLSFAEPPPGLTQMLEDQLKKAVRKALKAWRNDRQPAYQERVGTILREVLEELDRERREASNYKQPFVDEAHQKAVVEFRDEYVSIGCPVSGSLRFNSIGEPDFSAILDDVKETAVHTVGTDTVRYGLATYAYAYTATTVALWVYLVALVPRHER